MATPTPTPAPTLPPSSAGSLTTSTTQSQTAAFATIAGGYSGTITVAPATIATTLNATFATTSPAGAPSLASMQRRPRSIGASPISPVAFVTVTSAATVTVPSAPALNVALPFAVTSAVAATSYVAMYDPTKPAAGWTTLEGPATAAGSMLSFDGKFNGAFAPLTFTANVTYAFVAFTLQAALPTPTPSPTATPTATPVATASPTPAVAAAPAVGYLPATSTGSFAGKLNAISAGGTAVAISTTEVPSDGSALNQGNVAVSLGSTVLSRGRSTFVAREALGPIADVEQPADDPARIRAVKSGLRPAVSGRAPSAARRARSVGTTLGATTSFWVSVFPIGGGSSTDIQVPATLRAVTPNGYLWIDNTLSLDATTIGKLGTDLENAYASDTAHFGPTGFTAASPGIANHGGYLACDATGASLGTSVPVALVPPDAKVHAFVINVSALGSGVGGYFTEINYIAQSALNCTIGHQFTAQTVPHSNELPMFYVGWNNTNQAAFETDEDLVRGTSHELQHLINFVNHQILSDAANGEDAWINEGMSMLAQDFAVTRMFPGVSHDVRDALVRARSFARAPQNFSVPAFAGIDSGQTSPKYNCSGCYGAEFLFQRYLYDRFGGDAYLHAMLGSQTSYAGLQHATGVADAKSLLSDFAIALAASGSGSSDPRFGLSSLSLPTAYTDQFGTSITVGNPVAVGPPASVTPYFGSFTYFSLAPSTLGQNLSAKDLGGGFNLQVGIVQR